TDHFRHASARDDESAVGDWHQQTVDFGDALSHRMGGSCSWPCSKSCSCSNSCVADAFVRAAAHRRAATFDERCYRIQQLCFLVWLAEVVIHTQLYRAGAMLLTDAR